MQVFINFLTATICTMENIIYVRTRYLKMYYTPDSIAKIVNQASETNAKQESCADGLCEPSTGTSAFLSDAADMLSNPPYIAQHSLHPTQSMLARLWAMVIRALRG